MRLLAHAYVMIVVHIRFDCLAKVEMMQVGDL